MILVSALLCLSPRFFVVDASWATSTFDPAKTRLREIIIAIRFSISSGRRYPFHPSHRIKKRRRRRLLLRLRAKSKIEERERRSRSTHHLCLRGVRRGAQRHGGRDDRGDRFPGDGDDRLRGGCVIAVLLLRSSMGGSNHRRRRGRSSSGSSGPGDDARRRAAARQTRHARRRR